MRHDFYGRLTDLQDYFTNAAGRRYGYFTDRYHELVVVPLDEVRGMVTA